MHGKQAGLVCMQTFRWFNAPFLRESIKTCLGMISLVSHYNVTQSREEDVKSWLNGYVYMSFPHELVFRCSTINAIACTKPYGWARLSFCLLFRHIIPAVLVLCLCVFAYLCVCQVFACIYMYKAVLHTNRSVSYLKTSKLGRLTPMWLPMSSWSSAAQQLSCHFHHEISRCSLAAGMWLTGWA